MAPSNITRHDGNVDEQRVWKSMPPTVLHNCVVNTIFDDAYNITRGQIADEVQRGGYDCIVEVGSGTGEIIGELKLATHNVDRYGVDINPDFVEYCRKTYRREDETCEFVELDASLELCDWWKGLAAKKNYRKPLFLCVGNTLPIMPEGIRRKVVAQMVAVMMETGRGDDGGSSGGRCLLSFFNGHFLSYGIKMHYILHPELCGEFDPLVHVDWKRRTMVTPTGYFTTWMIPREVQQFLRSCDVDVDLDVDSSSTFDSSNNSHIRNADIFTFAWFGPGACSGAKRYYDDDDTQKFYLHVSGEENIHIGRYDLFTDEEERQLSGRARIHRAQEIHEAEYAKLIRDKFGFNQNRNNIDDDGAATTADATTVAARQLRILDMGCGTGGFLRRLWESGLVWSAVGCDISHRHCDKSRALNERLGCDKDITVLEESYLDISVPDESFDLVVSMDALLHVGPVGHHKAIKEASRVLRPGGWIIITDDMQREDASVEEMKPIYDRLGLLRLGTVSNYKAAFESAGFTSFQFLDHSPNIAVNYAMLRQVLLEKADGAGISGEFTERMASGLQSWVDLSHNLLWGFIVAQKTKKMQA